jgi:hypothetical protein
VAWLTEYIQYRYISYRLLLSPTPSLDAEFSPPLGWFRVVGIRPDGVEQLQYNSINT